MDEANQTGPEPPPLLPTEPGYYWFRLLPSKTWRIQQVHKNDATGELYVVQNEEGSIPIARMERKWSARIPHPNDTRAAVPAPSSLTERLFYSGMVEAARILEREAERFSKVNVAEAAVAQSLLRGARLVLAQAHTTSLPSGEREAALREAAKILTATYALIFADPPLATDKLGAILLNVRDTISSPVTTKENQDAE